MLQELFQIYADWSGKKLINFATWGFGFTLVLAFQFMQKWGNAINIQIFPSSHKYKFTKLNLKTLLINIQAMYTKQISPQSTWFAIHNFVIYQ